jgi:hypothetical protein
MGLASLLSLTAEGPIAAACSRPRINPDWLGERRYGDNVSVVVYLLLTVAVFAVLGTVVKLVERL